MNLLFHAGQVATNVLNECLWTCGNSREYWKNMQNTHTTPNSVQVTYNNHNTPYNKYSLYNDD